MKFENIIKLANSQMFKSRVKETIVLMVEDDLKVGNVKGFILDNLVRLKDKNYVYYLSYDVAHYLPIFFPEFSKIKFEIDRKSAKRLEYNKEFVKFRESRELTKYHVSSHPAIALTIVLIVDQLLEYAKEQMKKPVYRDLKIAI